MTDRELLELAAKAAAIKVLIDPSGAMRNCTGLHPASNIFSAPTWNPLTDDGDALRLAVKLGMVVSICDHPDLMEVEASVFPNGRPSSLMFRESYINDPYAATSSARLPRLGGPCRD